MSGTASHDDVRKSIEAGQIPPLRHAETVDKSKPAIEPGTTVKKVDRTGILTEIQGAHELRHVEPADRSAPVIEKDLEIKTVDRSAFLVAVTEEAKEVQKRRNSNA